MKFGIYSPIASPPNGEGLERCVDEVIEEAQLAEECGFDSWFIGERHQDMDGYLPSPLIVASAVAARTQRLRIGTSVILLPLHHPVQVAEDVITLDIVSRGRVILGVGLGTGLDVDQKPFGVPKAHRIGRFEESIEILRKCWGGEPFSFHGDHYTIENVQVFPKPIQRPGPRLWIGANSAPGVRRAARLADAFLTGPNVSLETVGQLVKDYREEAAGAEREPQVVLMRHAWVAQTRAEAEAVYGPEVEAAYRWYRGIGATAFKSIESEAELTFSYFANDRVIMGDPEECIRELHRWSEALGADYFVLGLRQSHSGGPPHDKIMEAIRLFGKSVIPYCS